MSNTLRLNMSGISLASKVDTESLGWGSSNNNNMYVGESAKDILPKDDDFVGIPFRLLSSTIVAGKSWRATEFPPNILKSSMYKLEGKGVFTEHDTELTNWVGVIKNVKWVEAKEENGRLIPSGIDATIMVDAKTNPKLVRALAVGGVYSFSVTIMYDWSPSHEFDSDDDFYANIGKINQDGEMIRRVATKVHDYYEGSVVFMGADPFAKSRDEDGNLINVDGANVYEDSYESIPASAKEDNSILNNYSISCGLTEDVLSLSRQNVSNTNTTNLTFKNNKMTKEVKDKLLELTGKQNLEDITVSDIVNIQENDLEVYRADLDDLKESFTQEDGKTLSESVKDVLQAKEDETKALKTDIDSLKEDKEELQSFKDSVINTKKENCIRLYKLSNDGEISSEILDMINSSDIKTLDTLTKEYSKNTVQTFNGKCKACGSSEISFGNKVIEPSVDNDGVEVLDFNGLRDKFSKNNFRTQ